jgi:2-oxoglutarate ferredoxin oxidoreductase subunit delta
MAKKNFTVSVQSGLCKACGICIALCPQQVFDTAGDFKAVPARTEKCVGCLTCEMHCPDFCVEVEGKEDE